MPAAVYIALALMLGLAAIFLRIRDLWKRYTCGPNVEEVLDRAEWYWRKYGIKPLISYAAENLKDFYGGEMVKIYLDVIDGLEKRNIPGGISPKPSSFVDRSTSAKLKQYHLKICLEVLLRRINKCVTPIALCLDEETTEEVERYVEPTVEVLAQEGKLHHVRIRYRCYIHWVWQRIKRHFYWYLKRFNLGMDFCRGTYPQDAEMSREEAGKNVIDLYFIARGYGIPATIASHTLVDQALADPRSKKYGVAVSMLCGRKEVETILIPYYQDGKITEAWIYFIFGPFWNKIAYFGRRLRENPSFLWRA